MFTCDSTYLKLLSWWWLFIVFQKIKKKQTHHHIAAFSRISNITLNLRMYTKFVASITTNRNLHGNVTVKYITVLIAIIIVIHVYGDKNPFESLNSGCKSEYLSTGTTIVGLCCSDGVVLGADTRTTGGPLVMDSTKLKIHFIAPRIYCCAAGTSADCEKLTRATGHFLAMQRIEKGLYDDVSSLDVISTALHAISALITSHRGVEGNRRSRSPKAVMILGGIDELGPSLYQIDENGWGERAAFAALGSGSMDAIASLECAKRNNWRPPAQSESTIPENTDRTSTIPSLLRGEFAERVCVEDAVVAVRNAVRAGILNDLGSGSHVDLCVITRNGVRSWREKMLSSWEEEKVNTKKNSGAVESKLNPIVGVSESNGTLLLNFTRKARVVLMRQAASDNERLDAAVTNANHATVRVETRSFNDEDYCDIDFI